MNIEYLILKIKNNYLIIKNYLALTFLHFINAGFYILIFPLVVPKIGLENYGKFVFISAVLSLYSLVINFGFETPGLRIASIQGINRSSVSSYFTATLLLKSLLSLLGGSVLVAISFLTNLHDANLYFLCYLGVISNVFIFTWYFQAKQQVIIFSLIQAFSKLIVLFFLLYFVDNNSDFLKFVAIINVFNLAAAFVSFCYICNNLPLEKKISLDYIIKSIKEATPYFWVNIISVIKYRSIELFIGNFFGMREVAMYDIANKIYSIPSILATSLNTSIYPKFYKNKSKENIKKLIYFEFILSALIVLSIVLFGNFAISLLSRELFTSAYYILIMLSFNIFAFLIVGCYTYFVFVPNNRGDLIFKNQLIALASYLILLFCLLMFNWSVYSAITALILSGFIEIFYCHLIAKKNKYL
jgi:PST family polysaccharide transporter